MIDAAPTRRATVESLHLLSTAQHRGAETFALDLATTMRKQGASTRAVALSRGSGSPLLDVPVLGERSRGLTTLYRLRQTATERCAVVAHGSDALAACALALPGRARFIYRSI